MNDSNARTTARAKLSPRYARVALAGDQGQPARAAMIPTLELRRLVATMVD